MSAPTEVIVCKGARYSHHAFYGDPCVIVFDKARPLSRRRWFSNSHTVRCVRAWWRRAMTELAEGV